MVFFKLLVVFGFTISINAQENPSRSDQVDNISYVSVVANGFFEQSGKLSTNESSKGNCGGIFRNIQNLIESPNYPISYTSNLYCEYEIKSPYICNNEFHIQFLDFVLEPSTNCEKDRLLIGNDEPICGTVIGVKKFESSNGRLNIKFVTDATINQRGFRLLITRLPCIEEDKNRNEVVETTEDHLSATTIDYGPCFNVNSSYAVEEPTFNSIPVQTGARQDIPVTQFPTAVPINPTTPSTFETPPQCCRNILNHPRFLLVSIGFPSYYSQDNDCVFVIQRSSPTICRLRITFKYFMLDADQFGCNNNFLEIDGQRICGCKSGFVYESQWGFEPKIIRLRTLPGAHRATQGFVLDFIQDQCPYKYTTQINRPSSPSFKTQKLFWPSYYLSSYGKPSISTATKVETFDREEGASSRFYIPPEKPQYYNHCVFSFITMIQLIKENFGIHKPGCLPYLQNDVFY